MCARVGRGELASAQRLLWIDGVDDVVPLVIGQKLGAGHADGAEAGFERDAAEAYLTRRRRVVVVAPRGVERRRRGDVGDDDVDGDGSAESCDHGVVWTRVQGVEDLDCWLNE